MIPVQYFKSLTWTDFINFCNQHSKTSTVGIIQVKVFQAKCLYYTAVGTADYIYK